MIKGTQLGMKFRRDTFLHSSPNVNELEKIEMARWRVLSVVHWFDDIDNVEVYEVYSRKEGNASAAWNALDERPQGRPKAAG